MPKQSQKDIAVAFLKSAVSGNIDNAFDRFVHNEFIHHNPYFKGDRQSLIDGMKQSAKEFPNKKFKVEHVLQDGDFVMVHARIRINSTSPWMVLIHIFRFEDGKIIEEWESSQEVPEDMINEYGMF